MDTERKKEEAMLREAAEWFLRVQGDAPPDEVAACKTWLDESAEHREAYRKIKEVWEITGRLQRQQ